MLFTYVLKLCSYTEKYLTSGPKFPLLKANMLPHITILPLITKYLTILKKHAVRKLYKINWGIYTWYTLFIYLHFIYTVLFNPFTITILLYFLTFFTFYHTHITPANYHLRFYINVLSILLYSVLIHFHILSAVPYTFKLFKKTIRHIYL